MLGSGGVTLPTPQNTTTALGQFEQTTANQNWRLQARFLTDTSSQIVVHVDTDTSVVLYIEVQGYEDARGRFD